MKKVLNGQLGNVFRKAIFRGYSFPVVVSLLLHGSLLLVLSTSWSVERKLNIVPPRNIKASLVEIAQPPQPKPRPQVDDSARKAREAAEQKRQADLKRRQAEEKRQREIALRKEREAKEQARKEQVKKRRGRP